MDRDYEVFFEIGLRDLIGGDLFYPRRIIALRYRDIINRISFERPNWRADAKYFLLYNVTFMLIDPIYYVRPRVLQSTEFRDALEEDIQTISNRAEEIASERERERVSSTSVSKALGELVDNLRTNTFRVCGSDGGHSSDQKV